MPPKAKAPDFGSQDYWDQRFTKDTKPFDWLSAPEALDPLINGALRRANEDGPRILHIGCGSSLLSRHLRKYVKYPPRQLHHVDYSKVVIKAEAVREMVEFNGVCVACAIWSAVDLLDYKSVVENCNWGPYSLIVDKSTSDAISCAEDVVCQLPYAVTTRSVSPGDNAVEIEPKDISVHPLQILAVHLALVTKPGARWIALSYTAERYPFLEGEATETEDDGTSPTGIPDPRLLWTVVDKQQIEAKEEVSGGGVTHRPKVYHWVYILQRTSIPLFTSYVRPEEGTEEDSEEDSEADSDGDEDPDSHQD